MLDVSLIDYIDIYELYKAQTKNETEHRSNFSRLIIRSEIDFICRFLGILFPVDTPFLILGQLVLVDG